MLTPGASSRRTSVRSPSLFTSYSTTARCATSRSGCSRRSTTSAANLEAEFAADDHQLHLGRAFAHRQDARIAEVAGDRVLIEKTISAEDLAGVLRVVDRGLAA